MKRDIIGYTRGYETLTKDEIIERYADNTGYIPCYKCPLGDGPLGCCPYEHGGCDGRDLAYAHIQEFKRRPIIKVK